jgi:hypothetical protein
MQGQSVHILGVNLEHTWFLVEHPQSFRYPCWVSNGSAVQVEGDLSCVEAVIIPNTSKLKVAQSEKGPSSSPPSGEPPAPVTDYCSLYPSLCKNVFKALQQILCATPKPCGPSELWYPDECICKVPPVPH